MVEYASTLPTALTSIGTLFWITLATTTGTGPPSPPLPLPFLPPLPAGASAETSLLLQPWITSAASRRHTRPIPAIVFWGGNMFTFTRLIASVYVVSPGGRSHRSYIKQGVLPASKVTINRRPEAIAGTTARPSSERLDYPM